MFSARPVTLYVGLSLLTAVVASVRASKHSCRGIVCEVGYVCYNGFCILDTHLPTTIRPQDPDEAGINGTSTPPQAASDGCANVKCPAGFACYNATCLSEECPLNRVKVGDECRPRVFVGDRCRTAEECPQGAICQERTCRCQKESTWISGACNEAPMCNETQMVRTSAIGAIECVDFAGWNEACGGKLVECSGNLKCSTGRCGCFEELVDGVCLRGDSCGQNKILHRGRCLGNAEERRCQGDADCPQNETCGADLRCKSSPPAICRPDEVRIEEICLQRAALGETCRHGEQCVEARCIEGRCRCAVNEIQVDGRCAKNEGFCRESALFTVMFEDVDGLGCGL